MNVRLVSWLAAIVLASGFAAVAPTVTGAQSDDATIRVIAPEDSIKEGDDPVAIDIVVENIQNMASFQFDLKYNADIFEFVSFERGDFLGSTGREVVCLDPVLDAGVVRVVCTTLRETPLGPDGGGKLATVFLKPTGSGKTELTLDSVQANPVEAIDPDEIPPRLSEIPLQTAGAPIEVESTGGVNWLVWLVIIGGAAVVIVVVAFGAMRLRSGSGRPATAT